MNAEYAASAHDVPDTVETAPPATIEYYVPELDNPFFSILVTWLCKGNIHRAISQLPIGDQGWMLWTLSEYEWTPGSLWNLTREILSKRLFRKLPHRDADADNLFQRVKASVQLEAFAARFTALFPAGKDKLKGSCPLHSEKTPSFLVYLDTQSWHCFGACASGGDVVELARRLIERGLF